jgi:alginate production protein
VTRTLPFLLPFGILASACVAPPDDGLSELRPGRFVEAKGKFVDGRPTVVEIDELPRTADDKGDKAEVTGPVERAEARSLQMLGSEILVEDDTEFEDADKKARERFVPAAGDWLRVKTRSKADGVRARTVRQMAPRDEFKVTGEVRRVDEEQGVVDIGGLTLPLAQETDLTMLGTRDPNDPLSLVLADDQKAVPFSWRVSDSVLVGGQLAGAIEWNDEFDLDDTDDRDRRKPEVRAKADVLWLVDDVGSYVLGEVTASRDDTIRQNGDDTRDETLEITRAFVSLRAADGLQILAGRQDFDEEREWLYDEVLDGVRGVLRTGEFEFELGAAMGRDFAASVNGDEDTGVLLGNVRWQLDPSWELTAYLLQKTDDTVADFEPLLFGVRSFSRPRYGLGHWLEIGGARGEAGGRDIRGHAFDVGALWTFDAPWRPSLGAGIAFASGRADSATESGYRQSGLQDNTAKLGGVTSVRYYGELLDPELANLTVTTICAAVRPLRNASISLLFHTYHQDVASAAVPDTELRVQPTGASRDIGHEIDLVIGYRFERRLTIELTAARFEPGDAFAGDSAANLLTLTTRFSF